MIASQKYFFYKFLRNLIYRRDTEQSMMTSAKARTHAWGFGVHYWVYLLLVTLKLFTCSCARIIAPEGGPKDTIPPKLIRTYPMKESTGFRGKKIKLVFDKKIEVRDIYNKLVVTPRLQKLENKPSYTYTVRDRSLQLTLEAPLEEETTYTFYFNDAIRDITEGNIAENVALSFSTGDHIDAMYVTGSIRYLMTHEPAPKVLVALYKADSTELNILNSPPDYFIKTDEEGNFQLDHIKQGKYYIYASTNKGNQLTVDLGTDSYGFLQHPIDLTAVPRENVMLSILKADVRAFSLQGQQRQDQYFELRFNKPVVDYTLTPTHQRGNSKKDPTLYSHLVEDNQIIRVYNTRGLLKEDYLHARLTARDILGTMIEEDIMINFGAKNTQNKPSSYTFTFFPQPGASIRPDFVGTMTVSKPVRTVATDQLFFVFNGQNTVHINPEDLHYNAQRDVITIKKQLDKNMLTPIKNKEQESAKKPELVFQIQAGAFVTVERDSNEDMHHAYTFRNPEEYGTIKGTVTTEAPGFIVQLLDLEHNVIDTRRNAYNYQFNEVAPGSYKLRLLVLRDKGAEWCFGNIYEWREPDPVVFYPADVAVIAHWEIDGIDFAF